MLNEELVIVRLDSEACLLVTEVVLWLSVPLKLRQDLIFSLIKQLHADVAWDICTKHETSEQSTDFMSLQIIECSFRKLLHYTELLCLCYKCLFVCTDCMTINYRLLCWELKYIIIEKVFILIIFFFFFSFEFSYNSNS